MKSRPKGNILYIGIYVKRLYSDVVSLPYCTTSSTNSSMALKYTFTLHLNVRVCESIGRASRMCSE